MGRWIGQHPCYAIREILKGGVQVYGSAIEDYEGEDHCVEGCPGYGEGSSSEEDDVCTSSPHPSRRLLTSHSSCLQPSRKL